MSAGLYIHVPFCMARCDFCAFYLQVLREDRARRFVAALSEEIRLHAAAGTLGGRPLETVYFGGGTPTTLPADQLAVLLEQVRSDLGLGPGAEVCVEAHPDTISPAGLRRLAGAGFNRLSLGVQSAEASELATIGRPAEARLPRDTVAAAREAGFANVNLDLMYGLPGQTIESWLGTLDAVLALEPAHLSCYALTVEPGTKYARDVRLGVGTGPEAERQNTFEELADRRLREAGLIRYEISNYCRPGFACRHNLRYWQGEDYLGLGPSAQSLVQGRRFGNVEHLATYLERLAEGQLPIAEREELDEAQRRREAVVFGLRMIDGVSTELVEGGTDPGWAARVKELIDRGLLEEASGRVRLTAFGRRHADSVAVELI